MENELSLVSHYAVSASTPRECLYKMLKVTCDVCCALAKVEDRDAVGDGFLILYYAHLAETNPDNEAIWNAASSDL
jgi:hypothetical protein